MTLQLALCEDQYKKFPHLDRNDVVKLQEWHQEQPHLPNITEHEAIIFLHACNYEIEKAKNCMDMYFTVRTHCPEFFTNRDVFGADMTARMKVSGLVMLPELTKEGYRVILCKLIDNDPSKFIYVDTVKFFNMVLDLWIAKNGPAEGYVIVFDMEGATFSHLTKVNIIAMRKFLFYIQEALPIHLRALHHINIPSFIDKMLAMMRPFLKKELLNAIHTHTSLDTFLDKAVPKAIMPDEYGGSAGKVEDLIEKGYKELQANEQFFIEEETTKKVNEDLRPGKPKTDRDIFGYFVSWFSKSKN